ncbi:EF-hand domain-containing protein [Oleisolibacter albus]|uniref:EF-hand domain-containing protein n=1 Tax=Oleisolibacter albus TaxID=2171757 RepID=UPI000DF117CD|nr:EF-hand domain-containing protein [Oleisolibacter albus]
MRSHLARRRVLGLVLLGGLLTGGSAWADDLADAFKRADADADGTLTPAEFRIFIDLRAEAGGTGRRPSRPVLSMTVPLPVSMPTRMGN